MAGYTDSPYRQLVKTICPRVICFTEFTSVDGILHGNEATMRQICFNPETERPIVAQIFGKKPENFRKAAKILTELGIDAIDINMGCPAKKIVSSDHGSSLLKNPSLSEEIVRATVESTALPVSVKMRVGTNCYDPDHFFDFALRMERAGAKLITIHGRTAKQMYIGQSDWQPIYELKKLVSIPVIGNGDIKSGTDALEKLGNLDGVMVGRGSFGNPWVFLEILAVFEKRPYTEPRFAEKIMWIIHHINLVCEGGSLCDPPLTAMRKHFAWYIRGIPRASEFRQQLVRVSSRDEAFTILREAFLSTGVISQELPQALPV